MSKSLSAWKGLSVAGAAAGLCLIVMAVLGHGWLALSIALLGVAMVSAIRIALESRQESSLSQPRRAMVWLVAVFFAATSLMLSVLIPPQQSPDEPSHMGRAYTLWEDDIFVKTTKGSDATQSIDRGLQTYLVAFGMLPYKSDVQLKREEKERAHRIRWFGKAERVYNPAAPYFPALYAPAAAGIGLAKSLGQPPWVAVSWARMLMWGTGVLATILALLIVQAGFRFLCGVALLPMTMAQVGSANLDATTIPLAFLLMALFSWSATSAKRIQPDSKATAVFAEFASWILLALLALAKPVFVVFLLWPVYRAVRERNIRQAIGVFFTLLLVGAWQAHIAGSGYEQPHALAHGIHQSPLTRLFDAVLSPIHTTRMLVESLVQKHQFYWESMVGILGWLDTPLSSGMYVLSGVLLSAALVGDALSRNAMPVAARAALLMVGFGYVIGCMLLLWATWTPPTSPVVEGISGRYFLPLLPALALGFGTVRGAAASVRYDWALLCLFGVYAICLMLDLPTLLIARYWL